MNKNFLQTSLLTYTNVIITALLKIKFCSPSLLIQWNFNCITIIQLKLFTVLVFLWKWLFSWLFMTWTVISQAACYSVHVVLVCLMVTQVHSMIHYDHCTKRGISSFKLIWLHFLKPLKKEIAKRQDDDILNAWRCFYLLWLHIFMSIQLKLILATSG